MSGDRRHYIPAGSIGFFSNVKSGARRERSIYCRRKDGPSSFGTKPDKVGWSRSVYGAGRGDLLDHDAYFKHFEALNSEKLDTMLYESGPWRSADEWVQCAAYLSSRVTRTRDWEIEAADILDNNPISSIGYPLNMQRNSSAVLRTRWELLYSPDVSFILNDRGFSGFLHPVWRRPALLMPMRADSAVVLGGGRYQKQVR